MLLIENPDRVILMKTRASTYVAVVMLLAALALSISCSRTPSDSQITSDIQSKVNADSGLQDKQLSVQVTNGTVVLSGTVDNAAERDTAVQYASSTRGVKQVVNNLQVVAASAPPTETTTNPVSAEAGKKLVSPKKAYTPNSEKQVSTSTKTAADYQPPVTPPPPPPPPPPPAKVTIPSGTVLAVRLVDSVDSEKNQVGDTFHATLNTPLTLNGDVVIPSGSDVQGHLADVKSAGKFAGQSLVVLQLDSITSAGNTYNIQTDQYKKQGSSRGKNTAEKVGAGAGIGALIGALAGGGKGAAIGAAAGGGLGGGVQAATKGQQIKLSSETVLNFTLQAPVTVIPTTQGPNVERQKLDANQ